MAGKNLFSGSQTGFGSGEGFKGSGFDRSLISGTSRKKSLLGA